MKLSRSTVGVLVLVTTGGAATSADAGNTREQVLNELAEARRLGDVMAPGCGGGTLREAFPHRYPPAPVAAVKPTATQARPAESSVDKGAAEPPPRR